MKRSDIEHVQRSRFLESSRKVKSQVENIVNSINLKYPELADSIEIPNSIIRSSNDSNSNIISHFMNYSTSMLKQKLLA
jgi:hypothetical protein